jgi:hypothetical protein
MLEYEVKKQLLSKKRKLNLNATGFSGIAPVTL